MFSFSFISGVSGTSLFNSVSLMAYNVFYTSIPVLVSVLDKDLNEGTVMQHPQILFYCQAGRCAIFQVIFCSFILFNFILFYSWDAVCLGGTRLFGIFSKMIHDVSWTGFLILVHLLDGLVGHFSMWVLYKLILPSFLPEFRFVLVWFFAHWNLYWYITELLIGKWKPYLVSGINFWKRLLWIPDR